MVLQSFKNVAANSLKNFKQSNIKTEGSNQIKDLEHLLDGQAPGI
jgi:hypothetical protein